MTITAADKCHEKKILPLLFHNKNKMWFNFVGSDLVKKYFVSNMPVCSNEP